MEEHIKDWMLTQIWREKNQRKWSELPQDFEYQAVKKTYHMILPHFSKKDIKIRILAGKCSTFRQLLNVIKS